MSDKNTNNLNRGRNGNYQGFFRPSKPEKYKGDPTKIVYRSMWERRMMVYCDQQAHVVEWSSEEVVIPYKDPFFDPSKNRSPMRRYFMDFWVKIRQNDRTTVQALIEVKPKKQVNRPKERKRNTRAYLNECKTWTVNQAKWSAATDYCEKRGWKFLIFTEDQLT